MLVQSLQNNVTLQKINWRLTSRQSFAINKCLSRNVEIRRRLGAGLDTSDIDPRKRRDVAVDSVGADAAETPSPASLSPASSASDSAAASPASLSPATSTSAKAAARVSVRAAVLASEPRANDKDGDKDDAVATAAADDDDEAPPPPPPPSVVVVKVAKLVCKVCEKAVYETEKLLVDECVFHKACFKCDECKKALLPGNYAGCRRSPPPLPELRLTSGAGAGSDGTYFCKPHFKQRFALKGNYSEGFGKEQHKKQWPEQVRRLGRAHGERGE